MPPPSCFAQVACNCMVPRARRGVSSASIPYAASPTANSRWLSYRLRAISPASTLSPRGPRGGCLVASGDGRAQENDNSAVGTASGSKGFPFGNALRTTGVEANAKAKVGRGVGESNDSESGMGGERLVRGGGWPGGQNGVVGGPMSG